MRFFIVATGELERSIICEESAVEWVTQQLKSDGFPTVTVVPAQCHWTAQVIHPRIDSDLETGWEG